MKVSISLLFAMAVCACSEPTAVAVEEPTGSTPADAIMAKYTLRRVNDQELPTEPPTGAGDWDYNGVILELAGGELTLYENGRYSLEWYHRPKGTYGPGQSMECVGTFLLIGTSTIRFDAGSTVPTDGAIASDGLLWNWGNAFVLKFST